MVVVGLEQQPVDERVASVAAAVDGLHDGLSAERVWQLPEAALLQACTTLARLRSGVEAAYLAAVAEVDRRRAGTVLDGVRGSRTGIGSSTESFLRTSAPVAPSQARDDVAAARALSQDGGLHDMVPLLARGDITRAHVDVATRCLRTIPEHLRSDESDRAAIADYFTGLAPTRHALELRRNAAALLERLAPDVSDRFDPRACERRFFDTTTDSTGMLLGHFALDAVAGATLLTAVEACSAPLPTDEDGRDDRTAPQRRADALLAIAERAASISSPARGERPRVVVHTTPEQLAGALATGPLAVGPRAGWTEAGQDLAPEAVRRLACDAVVQRVVWDRDGTLLDSVPLDLGRGSRLADVHLRRALAARDRGCTVPGCAARPAHCDAHHVVHWADGGPTSLGNSVLLCGSHHTAVHAGVWAVRMDADGIPAVVPPERVDPPSADPDAPGRRDPPSEGPSGRMWVVTTPTGRPSVLFVCVKNGGKSQMAEGLMRHEAGDAVRVASAGTRAGSSLNALSVESLLEVGVDIRGASTQQLTPELVAAADRVVVLGAEAQVEPVDGTPVEVWDTDEPSERGIEGAERMRLVRDDIARRVRALAAELTSGPR